MKTLLAATLGALMLAGPAMAATVTRSAGQPPAGVRIARMISTPFTYGTGDSQAMPNFNYQDSIPVTASVPGTGNSRAALPDSTMVLVNQTGNGG